jgi:predicted Rossmann fold flavoprotein
MLKSYDVVILGAGAAGMMAAIAAGKRGRSVLVLDHARAPGEKIRISGGGRCNFTNTHTSPKNFLSQNPHFAKSALARFTAQDFVDLVRSHGIAFHEKALGQLFCDNSAKDIITMLMKELLEAGAKLQLQTEILNVEKTEAGFVLSLPDGKVACQSLIVATGGKSIPKMGATGFAYRIAEQFGLPVVETRPALVPLTLEPTLLERLSTLAGVSVEADVHLGKARFREALLFTHRGLSGPAILQISSFWREGDTITLALEPQVDLLDALKAARRANGRQEVQTVLSQNLPKRLVQFLMDDAPLAGSLADMSDKKLSDIAARFSAMSVKPAGSEGYRTAEVTLGGVDTAHLDSRSMEAKAVKGLFFIGECVDVTGWLGGYNFQWAWSSGHAAGSIA